MSGVSERERSMQLTWAQMDRDERIWYFLNHKHMTYTQMAEALSTTRNAIAGAMQRAGIKKRDPSPNNEKLAINRAKHAERNRAYRQRSRDKKFRRVHHDGITSVPQVYEKQTSAPPRPKPVGPYRPLRIPFVDRKRTQCAWGLWPNHLRARDVPPGNLVVCGMPVASSQHDWCAHHIAIGVQPRPVRVRR